MNGYVKDLSAEQLIELYSLVIKELKEREIIRSKNVVGDLGEYIAINYYSKTKGLPKLQPAPPGTKNIDAISINGDRYSIKATTGNVTGVFYGLNGPGSEESEIQKFEYVIVVMFSEDLTLKRIIEIDWNLFLSLKKWHSRMRAWNLLINKEVLEKSKVVYEKNN